MCASTQWSTNCHPLTKNVKKETKIQPPPSPVDQEQALANLLDDLITADPQATNPQPMPSTTEEKTRNLNICLFHKCNLILFLTRTNENVFIKCQIDQCPNFMHEDSAYYYMSNVCCRLHESYLKRFPTRPRILGPRTLRQTFDSHMHVTQVTWAKCGFLIGRNLKYCALIG